MPERGPIPTIDQLTEHARIFGVASQILREIKETAETGSDDVMGVVEFAWGFQLVSSIIHHLKGFGDLTVFYKNFPESRKPEIAMQLAMTLRDAHRLKEEKTEEGIFTYTPSRLPHVWIRSHREQGLPQYVLVGSGIIPRE